MRGYCVGTWLFLRLLGVAYLSAFASFGVQARGLIGSEGILPFERLLDAASMRFGAGAYLRLPTLLWLWPSDGAPTALCVAGVIAALLLIADVAPLVCAAFLWLGYLSIASVGGIFLGYQWDALLLETGVIALLLAPMRIRPLGPAADREPSRLALLAIGFLLFRLMWASGMVKLSSGDPTWRDHTAMQYHYWSQPLPAWTAWYADAAPAAVHRASVVIMLVIELVGPFLLLAGRAGRRVAVALFVMLQAGIAATGNYGFFNVLSIAIALPMLDDGLFAKIPAIARRLAARVAAPMTPLAALGRVATWDASLVLLLLASVMFLRQLAPVNFPPDRERLLERFGAFELVHSYGLFAVMTTTRDEIVLEGRSASGEWRVYEFRWKPGDLDARPRFAPLHMPRLDWQMWFASLGTCEGNPWYVRMQQRLLTGSEPVRALFANDPFPEEPPVVLRSTRWAYRFSRDGSDAWWTRTERERYCPDLTLDDQGRIVTAPED